jgi:hypothetical protein
MTHSYRSRPIHGIPLYDGDLEASGGIPQSVTKLKQAIATADGLLLATPEYNKGPWAKVASGRSSSRRTIGRSSSNWVWAEIPSEINRLG